MVGRPQRTGWTGAEPVVDLFRCRRDGRVRTSLSATATRTSLHVKRGSVWLARGSYISHLGPPNPWFRLANRSAVFRCLWCHERFSAFFFFPSAPKMPFLSRAPWACSRVSRICPARAVGGWPVWRGKALSNICVRETKGFPLTRSLFCSQEPFGLFFRWCPGFQ